MRSSFAIAVLLLCAAAPAHAASPLTLWYDRPAADWEHEGLPIGNGAMGAMITGAVAEERVQFNEKTLWTGGPGSVQGYDFGLPDGSLAAAVKQVQAQIARDGRMEPEAVAKILGHKARGYGDYQSFGDVVLSFAGLDGPASNYRRELDIEHAVARVSFTAGGAHYTREYLASFPGDRGVAGQAYLCESAGAGCDQPALPGAFRSAVAASSRRGPGSAGGIQRMAGGQNRCAGGPTGGSVAASLSRPGAGRPHRRFR